MSLIHCLAIEELELLKENLEIGNINGYKYLDTWDYEDEYSHHEIEVAREQFIEAANEYLGQNGFLYVMKEMCENAMLCNKETGEVIR